MVELEIERQAKRLKELKLQKRKKTLLSINKEAHELELDMQASCRDPIQQTYPSRTKIINGLVNARGEYNHIDNNSTRTSLTQISITLLTIICQGVVVGDSH